MEFNLEKMEEFILKYKKYLKFNYKNMKTIIATEGELKLVYKNGKFTILKWKEAIWYIKEFLASDETKFYWKFLFARFMWNVKA